MSARPNLFPRTVTAPLEGHLYPLIMLRRLVLPAPLGPITTQFSPGNTSQSTWLSTFFPPSVRLTSEKETIGRGRTMRRKRVRPRVALTLARSRPWKAITTALKEDAYGDGPGRAGEV